MRRILLPPRRGRPRPAARPRRLLLVLLWPWLAGCADWSYERVRLGMPQTECRRLFTEDTFWQTELGFCYREQMQAGRNDAVVVLVSPDQRVAAKFQATRFEPAGWAAGQGAGYRLRGELAPKAAALDVAGPLDTLRAVSTDLLACPGARPVREVHAWVAAGLLRLMERWPAGAADGPESELLADVLAQVPADGQGHVGVDDQGTYYFSYRTGRVPQAP